MILTTAATGWFVHAMMESQIEGARAPYLQMVSSNAITIRWGTEKPAADTVFYGLSPDKLNRQRNEAAPVINHRVRLQHLQPDTRYYYRIRHQGKWLNSEANWFVTSPSPDKPRSSRVWVLGDPGKPFSRKQVRDSSLAWLHENSMAGRAYADLLLTTGDNAYPVCSNEDYSRDFFTPYQQVLKNIPVWPVFGNHDARRWAFDSLFDRPAMGQSGGLASHTKSYFSFDHGYGHFVLLDNHDENLKPGSDMLVWLREDLKLTRQKWTIVLFHHPPYTDGTYHSDNKYSRKDRMRRTRENILPILEQAGVDLVISGHSHVYERSPLLNCHYGKSDSFQNWMVADAGTGEMLRASFLKPARPNQRYAGTMYMVLGSSGEGNKGGFEHPALPVASAEAGSLILDLDNEQLTGRYITEDGQIYDRFTITKLGYGRQTSQPQSCEQIAEANAESVAYR